MKFIFIPIVLLVVWMAMTTYYVISLSHQVKDIKSNQHDIEIISQSAEAQLELKQIELEKLKH